MTVEITTPSQPPFLYAPTQVSSNGNGIQIDIYPNSGSLAAMGLLYETVTLGTFPVGTYGYEVVLHPAYQVNWGTRTNCGIFSIVGGTPPPMLILDEPQEGQQFATGDTIPLRASIANDSGDAWSVQFFSGDQPVAQSIPRRTVWWSEAWGGQHVLSARASNASGTLLISDSKTVLVGPGATLPVVKIDAIPWRTGEACQTCSAAPSVLTIRRTDPTNSSLTVYFTIDGTATPGPDYEALPASVEIPAGQRSVELNLLPIDDQLVEGPEIVRVRLLAQPPPLLPPTYFLNAYAKEALIAILDDEAGAPSARLDIAAPAAGAHLRFPSTVQLSAFAINNSNEVYGPVEFYANGQFVARSQVTASTRPPIAGLPSVHTAYWTNPPVGQYALTARTQLSYSQSITSPAVNVTVDAPSSPVVSLETAPAENAAVAEFCPFSADCASAGFVVRRSGATNDNLRVYLSYDGTAAANVDYRALSNMVVIPAGHESIFLPLFPIDDSLFEGPETVVATFTAVPGPGYIQDPAHNRATITIIDDDPSEPVQTVGIDVAFPISEESSYPFRRLPSVGRFRISRTGSTINPLPVYVTYSGSATPGDDYETLPLTATIPAGTNVAYLTVRPVVDNIPEGIETVVASISECPPPGLDSPCYDFLVDPAHARATVYIRDDGITESSVTITSPTTGSSFDFGEGIRIEATGVDLNGFISRVEFFADERKIGESAIQFVQPPDPGEPQTFAFVWREATPGPHVLTAQARDHTNGIVSSPPVEIRVLISSLPVVSLESWPSDNAHAPEFCAPEVACPLPAGFVVRRTGATNEELRVYLSYSGTATADLDYYALSNRIIIPAGADSAFIPVIPKDDDLTEGPETVVASFLMVPAPLYREDPFHWSAVVVIDDDEFPGPPIVTVAATDCFAVEPPTSRPLDTATFRVSRSGPSNSALDVIYSMEGTAENGIDYETLSGRAIIPSGSSSIDITIRPLPDDLTEGMETVILRLGPQPQYQLGTRSNAVALISDRSWVNPTNGVRYARTGDGCLHICWAAQTGRTFQVELSSDLRNWEAIFDVTAVEGAVHFVEDQMVSFPHRFYRLIEQPAALP